MPLPGFYPYPIIHIFRAIIFTSLVLTTICLHIVPKSLISRSTSLTQVPNIPDSLHLEMVLALQTQHFQFWTHLPYLPQTSILKPKFLTLVNELAIWWHHHPSKCSKQNHNYSYSLTYYIWLTSKILEITSNIFTFYSSWFR